MSGITKNRISKSIRFGVFDMVKHIYDTLSVVEDKVTQKVISILVKSPIRPTELSSTALSKTLVCTRNIVLKKIALALIHQLKVVSNHGKIIKNDLQISIFVSVVPGAVFFKIGRKLFIDRKLIHNRMQRYEKAREGYTKETNNQRSSGKPSINEKAQKN